MWIERYSIACLMLNGKHYFYGVIYWTILTGFGEPLEKNNALLRLSYMHSCIIFVFSNVFLTRLNFRGSRMWVKVAPTTSSMSTTNNKQFKTNHKKLQFPRIWLVHKSLYFGFAWLPIWLTGAGKPN